MSVAKLQASHGHAHMTKRLLTVGTCMRSYSSRSQSTKLTAVTAFCQRFTCAYFIGVAVQDAARPVLLLLLLQKALQLSANKPQDATKASVEPLVRQEESWPVALANSVCHQVSHRYIDHWVDLAGAWHFCVCW